MIQSIIVGAALMCFETLAPVAAQPDAAGALRDHFFRTHWDEIHAADCPLVIEPRGLGPAAVAARALLDGGAGPWQAAGSAAELSSALGPLPHAIRVDIHV